MKIFVVEAYARNDHSRDKDEWDNEGFAFLASSLDKAKKWIKEHGIEWTGDVENTYFIITAQDLDGHALVCESYGRMNCDAEKI